MDDTSTVAVDFFVSNRPFSSIQVSRTPAAAGEPLWLPHSGCSSRLYGNARNKACESNEADRYQMVSAPPLMHRKGHAGSGDQQRHQDHHGFGRCRFTCAPWASGDCADERAFHLLLNALHRTSADTALARDLAYAFAATQMRLDALFKRGIDPRPAELLAL